MALKRKPSLWLLAAALAMTATSVAVAQSRTSVHLDAATRNVGDDAFMTKYVRAFYCNLPEDNNQIVINSRGWNNTTGTGANAKYRIPMTQIFDDVWFVGNHYVGQYLIKTPEGLVQVDAGNNAAEVETFNYPAMKELGLSATYPLRAIFLTHGHFDHDGGAQWLLTNTGARAYLGSADASGKSYAPIPIDSADMSMRQMSIGGKTFWILPTPGHTPGATSAVLEVKDHGVTRRVLINGGQSMTSTIDQVTQYLTSIERTYRMASDLNVEGVMTPHIYWDGEGEKVEEIRAKGRTRPSQHIYGHDSVMRQLVVARECSAAWLTRLDSTLVLPVWRYNRVAFVDGSPTPNKVAARLSNGWGAVANRQLLFKVAETGASCAAVTNMDGVASCNLSSLRTQQDRLTVSFPGASTAAFVDLPAEATALVCSNGNCNAK